MHYLFVFCWLFLSHLAFAETAAPDSSSSEIQYPREVTSPQGQVVIHAPQIETWAGFEKVSGTSALEVTLAGMDATELGTVSYDGVTITDLEKRTVTFFNMQITGVKFPKADADLSAELDSFVRHTIIRSRLTIPLDLVLQYLDEDVIPTGPPGLSLDPPEIFYAISDSRLLTFDGPPALVPIEDTQLKFAVNTNWDVFYTEEAQTWYLRVEKRWLTMQGEKLTGELQSAGNLPPDFEKLPDTLNWEAVRAAVPASADNSKPPEIFISEVPAELILIDGEPQLEAIADTGISYVTNTEADLFRTGGAYYYLVSGRWFSAAKPDGDWSTVSKLPDSFAHIPPDHPRGDVLVAVAGTDEAKIAVLEAVIPRKAELSRDYVPPVKVEYSNGEPQFELIPSTKVLIAVNTQYQVLKSDDLHYLCYNAAWFISPEPSGPWVVADKIPDDIYSIPMSSSAYNCTHVYVYDDDNEFSVTTGYDSGYFHVYTSYGVPMYGTGWYYPPYYYYPYYYGYPRSYGSGAWYNPDNGNYGAGQAVYGPYGGASRVAVYNPETGAYGRGRSVWDGDEIARQGIAYNPSTGTGVYTNRYANDDGAWGESLVKRDDKWIATQSERQGDSITTDFKTSGGASGTLDREINDGTVTGSGEITRGDQTINSEMARTEDGVARKFTDQDGNTSGYVRNSEGDLYAGKDGEVYKREDGEWYQHGGDGWDPVEREAGANADRRADNAAERQRDAGASNDFDLQRSDIDAASMRSEPKQYRQMGTGSDRSGMGTPGAPADIGSNPYDLPGGNPQRDSRSGRDYQRDRASQLDRDYRARSNGFDRHNSSMNRRSRLSGGRMRGGGRRR